MLLLLLLLFYRPFTSEFSSPSLRLRSVCLDIFWSSSVLHLSAPLLPLHISLCLHQCLYLPLSVFITWNITSLSCCKCFSPLNHSSISAPLSPLTSSSPSFCHVSVFFFCLFFFLLLLCSLLHSLSAHLLSHFMSKTFLIFIRAFLYLAPLIPLQRRRRRRVPVTPVSA